MLPSEEPQIEDPLCGFHKQARVRELVREATTWAGGIVHWKTQKQRRSEVRLQKVRVMRTLALEHAAAVHHEPRSADVLAAEGCNTKTA
jgi:hypothetical protein